MGLINHNAVIATTWDESRYSAVLVWIGQQSDELRGLFVTAESIVNGDRTIILAPDGSKEGWAESDRGDQLRADFISRLNEDAYKDGSSPWKFVEVSYGELGAKVEATNCENVVD